MCTVIINDCVSFSANNGVSIGPNYDLFAPELVWDMLAAAFEHVDDEVLFQACCGGVGPLAGHHTIDYDDYLLIHLDHEKAAMEREATKAAKKRLSFLRRREFDSVRAQLSLAMIDSGTPYVCAERGCFKNLDLTIDHIVPLSKGGSDEIDNLQFMCRSHNSKKGDRTDG